MEEVKVIEKKDTKLNRAWNWVKTHKLETFLIVLGAVSTGTAIYEGHKVTKRLDEVIDDCNDNFDNLDKKIDRVDKNGFELNDFVNDHLVADARATNSIAQKLGWSEEEYDYITVHKQDGSYVTPYNDHDVYKY